MARMRQYTLAGLFRFLVITAGLLGVWRSVEPEWRFVLVFAGAILVPCLVISRSLTGRLHEVGRYLLAPIAVFGAWLLWLGLYPAFYYMLAPVLVLLFWLGVLVTSLIRAFIAGGMVANAAEGPAAVPLAYERAFYLIPLVTTLLIALAVPLRLGFLAAFPALTPLLSAVELDGCLRLPADRRCGFYTIAANAGRHCNVRGGVFFIFADDPESAFIYSPSGIDNLQYNSGTKGHLFGNWYWMKED